MVGAPSGIVVSATLCASGIASRRTRPDSKRIPAGKPPSFTTIATLSAGCTWIERGWLSLRIESKSTPSSREHAQSTGNSQSLALEVEVQQETQRGNHLVADNWSDSEFRDRAEFLSPIEVFHG